MLPSKVLPDAGPARPDHTPDSSADFESATDFPGGIAIGNRQSKPASGAAQGLQRHRVKSGSTNPGRGRIQHRLRRITDTQNKPPVHQTPLIQLGWHVSVKAEDTRKKGRADLRLYLDFLPNGRKTRTNSMTKTIALLGALDTKGQEFAFLKSEIGKRDCDTLVIDVGIFDPQFPPDVAADQVAEAGGAALDQIRQKRDRGEAMAVMHRGAAVIVRRLFAEGKFQGIIAMGGGGGTSTAAAAMRTLPIGVPKLLVSTVFTGDVGPYVGASDITMMPSIVDVSGLNRISRTIFTNAAGAICGMAQGTIEKAGEERPLIGATMFGNTTRAVDHARQILEGEGYEVLVFHATGAGGRTMESLIESDYLAAVLDLTTTEWADEICGGVLAAGPNRLEAAAKKGIPQVVTPACLDMCNFWAPETVPAKYKDRLFYHWNPNVTLMRTTPEENAHLGRIFAEKLNAATGPITVLVPMGGFSELDFPGKPFWSPEADQAFLLALRESLRADIPVEISDKDVNHPEFSARAAEVLLASLKRKSVAPTASSVSGR
jgi:uncharacterized protein (UPF0261 family)